MLDHPDIIAFFEGVYMPSLILDRQQINMSAYIISGASVAPNNNERGVMSFSKFTYYYVDLLYVIKSFGHSL